MTQPDPRAVREQDAAGTAAAQDRDRDQSNAAQRPGRTDGAPGQEPEPVQQQERQRQPGPEQGPAPNAQAEMDADAGAETDADVLAADVARLEDRWRRTLADLDNLRKRCAKEVEAERARERDRVAAAWLPIVDNLELALAHAHDAADGTAGAVIDGVRAVRDQAVDLLARLGYPRHDEVGIAFDPARHDAVGVVPVSEEGGGEETPGSVVRVMRPGYGQGERQLRPAAVMVARARE